MGKAISSLLSNSFLDLKDLLTLLMVNKDWRKRFYKKVYRVIFHRYGNNFTPEQRKSLWTQILNPEDSGADYKKLLDDFLQVITFDKTMKHVEEVITIDVQRSFIIHKELNPATLQNLLRAYSNYDKVTSYCQGMNYIMGFLQMNLEDEETTLKCFCQIMNKYMKDVFDKEFFKLKVNFHKFNKLIDLYLPKLAYHFREEKVDASYFVPAWFITVFSNTFQYTLKSKFLVRVWDFFLLDGMKVIFKVGLIILKLYEQELLGMKFDAILHFLGDIGKNEIFTNNKYFAVKEEGAPLEEATKEFKTIENVSTLLIETQMPSSVLAELDKEYFLYEHKVPKYLKELK